MVPPDIPSTYSGQKSYKDYVTPHKISLLVLIKEFCLIKQNARNQGPNVLNDDKEERVDITSQQHRDFAVSMWKLLQSPDMDLKELIDFVQPILHPTCYQHFSEKLQELRKNGVAGIMDYIAAFDYLLTESVPNSPVIQKSSVLGLFIRHMYLAFDKLTFSHVTKLCYKYYIYFDSGFNTVNVNESTEVNITDSHTEVNITDSHTDEILDDSDCEEFHGVASQKQAGYFIAQQAALLQINEGAALSPFELQQKIKELLKGNPELVEAYYLSFLNSLRVKEFSGAQENMYHHFDRNAELPQECKSTSSQEEFNRSSRYAALNLAILHTLFGHREEALQAINEAITVAQEVNDNICLQYALAWLYRLMSTHKEILIERSIAKSGELGLWCLSSLGIQALTKLKCLTSALPSSIFDLLIKSDIQNCQHSMTDMLGPASMLRAGLWSYYGHSTMANLSSQMLLYLNSAAHGGVYHIGEGTCFALRNLTMFYALEGDYSKSSLVLGLAKKLFPLHTEHSHIWQLCDLLIQFHKALYAGKWEKAQKFLQAIAVFDKDEANYRKAQLLFNEGHLTNADKLIENLLVHSESKKSSPHFHVRVLLLKAELLYETSNFAVALSSLMTCLSLCKNFHLLYLEALTTLQVASIQLTLGLPNQARNLLDTIFISILTHGSCYDKGCCFFTYARCLADAIFQTKERNTFKDAISMSNKALEYFKKITELKKIKLILSWQAHIYNHLEMTVERNNTARKLRLLDDELS